MDKKQEAIQKIIELRIKFEKDKEVNKKKHDEAQQKITNCAIEINKNFVDLGITNYEIAIKPGNKICPIPNTFLDCFESNDEKENAKIILQEINNDISKLEDSVSMTGKTLVYQKKAIQYHKIIAKHNNGPRNKADDAQILPPRSQQDNTEMEEKPKFDMSVTILANTFYDRSDVKERCFEAIDNVIKRETYVIYENKKAVLQKPKDIKFLGQWRSDNYDPQLQGRDTRNYIAMIFDTPLAAQHWIQLTRTENSEIRPIIVAPNRRRPYVLFIEKNVN